MNIFVNLLSNSLIISEPLNKKRIPYYKEFTFSYSLKTLDNKIRAFNEILTDEVCKIFTNEVNNTLLLSDDAVFHGLMSIPAFSSRKTKDAFETKFKIEIPNFSEYYLVYDEHERNSSNSFIRFTISREKQSKALIDVFEHHNIKVKNVEYLGRAFSNYYQNKSNYPQATLLIGSDSSEMILTKAGVILGGTIIDVGSKHLLDSNTLINSTFNVGNEESLKYVSFHKEHFDTKESLSDEIILKYSINESFIPRQPKEERVIKGASLENYIVKTNFIKFHARILDILDTYKEAPYFLPIQEVNVSCTDEVFGNLLTANKVENFKYVQTKNNIKTVLESSIHHNPLFSTKLTVKERRKIDWAKLLTMEIGKKKKA